MTGWLHRRPLVVQCLLVDGPDGKQPYGRGDVLRLQRGLQERMPIPYWFATFCDVPLDLLPGGGMERAQIQTTIDRNFGPGWWRKLGLWHQGGSFSDHCGLFIDLDTIIVGDMTPIVQAIDDLDDGKAIWLSDFYEPARIASGLMAWTPGWAQRDGLRVSANAMGAEPHLRRTHHGDQDFAAWHMAAGSPQSLVPQWPRIDRWQDVAPGAVVSYKEHLCAAGRRGTPGPKDRPPPDGTVMVCFHGQPKPMDLVTMRSPWARANWWSPGDPWAPMARLSRTPAGKWKL